MPTYEYRCADGHQFDLFQRMSDEPRADCPECGKPAERILSAGAGFLFKGKGFYITDYRSDDYKRAAKSETGNGAEAVKPDSSGTGSSKPETKPGGKPAKPKGTSSSTESS